MENQILENYNQNRYKTGTSGNQEADWLYAVTSSEAPESDVDMAWEKISIKIADKKKSFFPILRVAASVILLAACVFVFRGYFLDSPELIVKQSHDGKTQVVFPDGSKAVLNSDSQVEFLEKFGETREINFSGEAYFDIKKNKKPFIIKMGEVDVRVLGTAFNLVTGENKIMVLVERGLVALEKGGTHVEIGIGEQGTFNRKTSEFSVDTIFPANVMSWRNGKFSFKETTLEEVTTELSKYYDVTFELSATVRNCKITVNFDSEPLKDVLGVLETILNLSIEKDNLKIRIKGKGC